MAHDLIPPESDVLITADPVGTLPLRQILDAWQPINRAVNAIAESLGVNPVYPIEPHGLVIDKLEFVHRQVGAHTDRDRFYATS